MSTGLCHQRGGIASSCHSHYRRQCTQDYRFPVPPTSKNLSSNVQDYVCPRRPADCTDGALTSRKSKQWPLNCERRWWVYHRRSWGLSQSRRCLQYPENIHQPLTSRSVQMKSFRHLQVFTKYTRFSLADTHIPRLNGCGLQFSGTQPSPSMSSWNSGGSVGED